LPAPGASFQIHRQAEEDYTSLLPLKKLVTLPTGSLGVVFKGSIAKVSSIRETSLLKGIIREGFVVDTLTVPNGTEYVGCSANQLVKALTATSDIEGRTLLLKGPQNSTLPSDAFIKVVLPRFGNAVELGLVFGEGPTIAEIEKSSALVGKLSVGQTLVALHDGLEREYRATSEESVEDALLDSSGCQGRYFIIKA
jgi:hypothetical protein